MKLEDDILIERFLKDELSSKEKTSFLERINLDADFKESFELEKQLFESLDDNSWNFIEDTNSSEVRGYESILRNQETLKIKQAIQEAQKDYQSANKPTKNWFLYLAAAVVIVLFSTLIFNTKSATNDELFAAYLQETDLMSLVDRGEYDSIFSVAQNSFDSQEYSQVVNSLSQLVDTINNSNAFIYLAISQIKLEDYSNAEETLNKLINSDLLDSQKGYWYKSLLYLKSNQLEKTKTELQRIVDSYFYQSSEAQELLKEIE